MWSNISLKTKVSFYITLFVLVMLFAFIAFLSLENQRTILRNFQNDIDKSALVLETKLKSAFVSISEDVLFLSQDPCIVDSLSVLFGNDQKSRGRACLPSRVHVEEHFGKLLAIHKEYFQIRFISSLQGGQEVIRVERGKGQQQVVILADEKMQNKSHRDYYLEAIKLSKGDIYFSRFNLNQEHGQVEFPFRPTIRSATPIYNYKDQLIGIVIINIDATRLFQDLTEDVLSDHHLTGFISQIANDQGDWIVHRDSEKSFGFERGKRYRIEDEIQEFQKGAKIRKPSENLTKLSNGNYALLKEFKIPYGNDQNRILYGVYIIPQDNISSYQNQFLTRVPIPFLIFGLLVLWFIGLIINRYLNPLKKLADASRRIASGDLQLSLPESHEKEPDQVAEAIRNLLNEVAKREVKLQDSETRSNLIVDNIPIGILVADSSGIIIRANNSLNKMFGYQTGELIGKQVEELVPMKSRKSHVHLREGHTRQAKNRTLSTVTDLQGQRKTGELFPVDVGLSSFETSEGIHILATVQDISDKIKAEKQLWTHANFDFLTGLPNRKLFLELLDRDIKTASRRKDQLWLLFLDLDGFKEVNDSYGHAIGDKLLVQLAGRLKDFVRESDILSRLGGDEFVLLINTTDNMYDVDFVAESLMKKIGTPFEINDLSLTITTSIGIANFPNDAKNSSDLMRFGDQAMYAAKASGKNQHFYFTPEFQKASELRAEVARDLRAGVSEDQFKLCYQAIIDISEKRVTKAEALIRWLHPVKGLMSPEGFIGVAEETGSIVEIGDWVFKSTASQLKKWQSEDQKGFQISVNVSPKQLMVAEDKFDEWSSQIEEIALNGTDLVIEITEGVLLESNPIVNKRLVKLREKGFQIAIDDFGTGYSSLAYLSHFDIDYLKIDRSFVVNLEHDKSSAALVEAIIVMAHKLEMKVIAEGVETKQQFEIIEELGCDYAQGYYFSKPLPANEFEERYLN